MDFDQFAALFDRFDRRVFRFEGLPQYLVDQEADDLAKYLAGEPLPPNENEGWASRIRAAADAGKTYERVRLLPDPMTPYTRFEIEWCYLYSDRAGEVIRVLGPEAAKRAGAEGLQDFWLFDETAAVLMRYDQDGRFEGVDEVSEDEVPRYVELRDSLMVESTPLQQYLADRRRQSD